MRTISLSESRARKLVKAWEGHIANCTDVETCAKPESKCPIHKYFMEIKKKVA